MGKRMRLSPKTEFSLKKKNDVRGGLSEPIEILFIFWSKFEKFY